MKFKSLLLVVGFIPALVFAQAPVIAPVAGVAQVGEQRQAYQALSASKPTATPVPAAVKPAVATNGKTPSPIFIDDQKEKDKH